LQREGEQPHHHPLVGFRRVTRDRQRMVAVHTAVDVGDRQVRLEDRRLEGHGAQSTGADYSV
jgi:hypothetical protein